MRDLTQGALSQSAAPRADIRTQFTIPVQVYVWLQTALYGLNITERTVLLRIVHTKEGLGLSVQQDHNNAENSSSKGEENKRE